MKTAIKIILISESIIAFLPITVLWLMSVPMLPISLQLMVTEGGESYAFVAMTCLGGIGLWGVLQLLFAILCPRMVTIRWWATAVFLLAGFIALAVAVVTMGVSHLAHIVMFLMPVLVCLHFCYLALLVKKQRLQQLNNINKMVQ